MKVYFFKFGKERIFVNLKYRNLKYLFMFNYLRFYLFEVFFNLDKILFLDDDVVVKKDFMLFWLVSFEGKVNGVVEICGKSFYCFDKYLNFLNLYIVRNFDFYVCGWVYGMNIFDLKEWKKCYIIVIYYKW